MMYGDEVTITDRGIAVPLKELQPIDVFPDSTCWGTWLPPTESSGAKDPVEHLFLSPVPPESWPVAFRLRLRVWDQPGALHAISTILRREHVNVLFAQATRSSRRSAFWYALCEATPLRIWANELLVELAGKDKQDHVTARKQVTRAIGLALTAFVERLCWLIRVFHAELCDRSGVTAKIKMLDVERIM
ncbi:MAG: hypothetical protein AAGB34_00985, partial [Planctomycetota bacterium]